MPGESLLWEGSDLSLEPRGSPPPPPATIGVPRLGKGGRRGGVLPVPAPTQHLAVLGLWWEEFGGSGGPGAPEGLSMDPSLQQQAPPEQARPQAKMVFPPLPFTLNRLQLPSWEHRVDTGTVWGQGCSWEGLGWCFPG